HWVAVTPTLSAAALALSDPVRSRQPDGANPAPSAARSASDVLACPGGGALVVVVARLLVRRGGGVRRGTACQAERGVSVTGVSAHDAESIRRVSASAPAGVCGRRWRRLLR